MTQEQVKEFLAQFAASKSNIAAWPKWMRDASRVATASFPKAQK